MEKWVRKNILHQGRVLTMITGDAALGDGSTWPREIVEHPGGVAIVPVLGDAVVLVRQYRIALGMFMDEIPSGKLEGGESPEQRAHEELEEETGYRAVRLVPAGAIFPSIGYTSERINMFLAFDLEETEQRLDADERIEVVTLPIADIRAGLRSHTFEDAKTALGFHRLLAYLDSNLSDR